MKRLIFLVLLMFTLVGLQAQTDSLGVEKKGELLLVLHKVQSGQTLYSLARRYGATVAEIQTENPELSQGLKVGQTIKIPYGKVPEKATEVVNTAKAKIHTVGSGETLYSISRRYGVSVDDIKRWNNLPNNNLSSGQKLRVSALPVQPPAATTLPVQTPDPQPEPEVTTPVQTDEVADTVQDQVSADTVSVTLPEDTADTDNTIDPQETVSSEPDTIDYPGRAFTEVKRVGVAELIVEDEPSSKFLALHKTAEVGTVIKIRNLKNDLTVYVRVVGQIPDTADNENVLIKINKRAHDQLKAIDPRFRVELSYFQ